MKLVFSKSKWELGDATLEDFLKRVKADGFQASELNMGTLTEKPQEIIDLHQKYGLQMIGAVLTQGKTCADHLASLEKGFEFASQCQVLFVNTHAGRDIFSFEENIQIFERIIQLSRESGMPILTETHRGRPTYSAIETRKYLQALPELRLTADFSHWMVVHESDLSDQAEALELAISRSDYIHARVGYAEGPQVTDPRAPEWKAAVETHLRLWHKIADRHKKDGKQVLHITPEFGPPAYSHTLPFSNEPVRDVWEINVYMKELLSQEIAH